MKFLPTYSFKNTFALLQFQFKVLKKLYRSRLILYSSSSYAQLCYTIHHWKQRWTSLVEYELLEIAYIGFFCGTLGASSSEK